MFVLYTLHFYQDVSDSSFNFTAVNVMDFSTFFDSIEFADISF